MRAKPDRSDDTFGLTPLELARIAPMDEAAHLSGLSVDTLKRHHADRIIRLSPRRAGMRLRHCLMLASGK
jgi:hypothetical protein